MSTQSRVLRIGQIVPSSNTTMETEIPAILRGRESVLPERFTFHSSRMRMKKVTKEELEAMDKESERCALELSDARMDAMAYACLVAIMSMGRGYHRTAELRLHEQTRLNGAPAPVVTSAGALVDGAKALGATRVSLVCPYMKPLARLVIDYIEAEGINVKDYIALEIPDNVEVGRQDPMGLCEIYKRLDLRGVDVLVLSACVQMPSLPAIHRVEQECGMPVISAAVCTAFQLLKRLGLQTRAPQAGTLLCGKY